MKGDNFKLINGSTVVIIGGGPAGASAGIKLLKEGKKKGLNINVFIFEGKDFTYHYNQCVGVLSYPIREIFDNILEIPFPEDLIRREILGYDLYSMYKELELHGEKGTYATRRILFDRFMLHTAQLLGAHIIRTRVTDLEFNNSDSVHVYTEGGFVRADVVVGAFGLDDGMANILEHASKHTIGYTKPTKVLETIITKIHIDRDILQDRFESKIHAFIPLGLNNLEFGAITPKGDHIIINIAGKHITSKDMDAFLEYAPVKNMLYNIRFSDLDYYKGKFPIKPAKGIIGNRFVAVGDATGWVRPYKGKGINIALETGAKAADIMIKDGFSKDSLELYPAAFKHLKADFFYSKLFRSLVVLSIKTGFVEHVLEMAEDDPSLKESLFMVVSGEGTYRKVIKNILSPKEFVSLSYNFIKNLFRRVQKLKNATE